MMRIDFGTNTTGTSIVAPTPLVPAVWHQHYWYQHCGTNTTGTSSVAPTLLVPEVWHQHYWYQQCGTNTTGTSSVQGPSIGFAVCSFMITIYGVAENKFTIAEKSKVIWWKDKKKSLIFQHLFLLLHNTRLFNNTSSTT